MQGPRLLVVARRFWPFTDDNSLRLLHQCAALMRAGVRITLLTGRWHPSWPEFCICREIPIHRLLPAPSSNWNESHFQKNVVNWVGKTANNYDCIYVDRADGLLSAVSARSAKWNLPVIARFAPDEGAGLVTTSQKLNSSAMADACRRVVRVVCTSPSAHRLLVSHGIPESRIQRISDTAWDPIPRSEELRTAASNALFETSCDFVVPGRSDILLHLGVSEPKPLLAAIRAICDLLDTGLLLRLWIVGCGVDMNSLYDLIKSRGWQREILIFDGFDDLQELIRVADFAIASNPKDSIQYTLPMMAAAGVPMLIAESPDTRAWLPDANQFQLYSSEQMLAQKLLDWVTNRERWVTMANSLKQSLRRSRSGDDCVQQWLALFRDIIAERTA